jgi:hypothetical protein
LKGLGLPNQCPKQCTGRTCGAFRTPELICEVSNMVEGITMDEIVGSDRVPYATKHVRAISTLCGGTCASCPVCRSFEASDAYIDCFDCSKFPPLYPGVLCSDLQLPSSGDVCSNYTEGDLVVHFVDPAGEYAAAVTGSALNGSSDPISHFHSRSPGVWTIYRQLNPSCRLPSLSIVLAIHN